MHMFCLNNVQYQINNSVKSCTVVVSEVAVSIPNHCIECFPYVCLEDRPLGSNSEVNHGSYMK